MHWVSNYKVMPWHALNSGKFELAKFSLYRLALYKGVLLNKIFAPKVIIPYYRKTT
jgi:hypothetical protein